MEQALQISKKTNFKVTGHECRTLSHPTARFEKQVYSCVSRLTVKIKPTNSQENCFNSRATDNSVAEVQLLFEDVQSHLKGITIQSNTIWYVKHGRNYGKPSLYAAYRLLTDAQSKQNQQSTN